jgi:hypothetical protein
MALAGVVAFTAQSMHAQTGVVFTESAGTLSETLNGAPIGNWGTATVSGGVETWVNADPNGAGNVIGPDSVIPTYEFPEPADEPGLFNILTGGVVMSDAPASPNAASLPFVFIVIDPSSTLGVVAVPVTFVDNGDTVTSIPGGTPVPDGASTLPLLMLAGGVLGLARQRNLGLAAVRPAA